MEDQVALARVAARAAEQLGLRDRQVSEGMVIRVYLALRVLVGEEQDKMRHWLRTPNLHLNGIPEELLESTPEAVLDYLERMRGSDLS